jgi:hypothetical protein
MKYLDKRFSIGISNPRYDEINWKKEEPLPERRSCNRHDDCDAANVEARERGYNWATHCHDECCQDCFGS